MKKVYFTLHDAPDFTTKLEFDVNLTNEEGELRSDAELAMALLINKHCPNLKDCHRRIKKLIVIDEEGQKYESDDFDVYGSLQEKKEDKNETD